MTESQLKEHIALHTRISYGEPENGKSDASIV